MRPPSRARSHGARGDAADVVIGSGPSLISTQGTHTRTTPAPGCADAPSRDAAVAVETRRPPPARAPRAARREHAGDRPAQRLPNTTIRSGSTPGRASTQSMCRTCVPERAWPRLLALRPAVPAVVKAQHVQPAAAATHVLKVPGHVAACRAGCSTVPRPRHAGKNHPAN